MTDVALSRIHFPVTTLGPGRRVAVWFQGCSIRCVGCVSLDTWAVGRGATTVERAFDAIVPFLADADGLTVSGGEPFDQPEALAALLRAWRSAHRGDVLVYSGHPLEALEPTLSAMRGLVDAVMADPYLVDRPQTLALRGSDNQRLRVMTPLGRERLASCERPLAEADRTLDVTFDDLTGEVLMAGIPRPGDMARLAAVLAAGGHAVVTTADARVRS
ncbi:4Fe-4S cluster-binding domain-containing protein [Lichenibacterium ramalinae]|uniref:4Fe-4S cluster-binding domain-containing protein n=1 Tax=Lichenibacterium ramalinae TaxID=2316527 RepID=A0A4Q2RB75_9HYPH|nr:4Fe-4S cluster-binding domain-containing protein [Lichenibacterium ramalinae]RYB04420.1 4Fe-4S cluster-binding domain-containing protein [Lichenibacterium ramalinae]